MPIRASIELLRPINGLITAGSVLLAAWLATGQLNLPAFIAAFSATLIAGFGNGHNDIVDVEVDRLAHPNRPLPASGISGHAARRVTWACALVGCVSAMALPPSCLAIAGVNTFGLWFYNRRAKWWPFFGNALIAAIAASTFIYGGFAVGSLRGIWPITLFAFTLHLSREIIKDLEDLGPDRERGGKERKRPETPRDAQRRHRVYLVKHEVYSRSGAPRGAPKGTGFKPIPARGAPRRPRGDLGDPPRNLGEP